VSVRTALYGLLSADGELTALLSSPGAIHHRVAPQGERFPYVVFHKARGAPVYQFADHHNEERWVVKGVSRGPSASEAEAIDARILAVLQDAALAIADGDCLYARRELDVDYGEDDGGETIHHVGAEYRLVIQPGS